MASADRGWPVEHAPYHPLDVGVDRKIFSLVHIQHHRIRYIVADSWKIQDAFSFLWRLASVLTYNYSGQFLQLFRALLPQAEPCDCRHYF